MLYLNHLLYCYGCPGRVRRSVIHTKLTPTKPKPFQTLFVGARNHRKKQTWGLCQSYFSWNFFFILLWSFASMFLSYFLSQEGNSLSFNRSHADTGPASPIFTVLPSPVVWKATWRGDPPAAGPSSHVVSHVYGVQLVGQESVSEVHALLLPSGVDGDDAGVDHHHHPYDEVVLFQDNVGDQGHQVQGLLLRSLQLHNHHEEVCPSEHRTGEWRRWWRHGGEEKRGGETNKKKSGRGEEVSGRGRAEKGRWERLVIRLHVAQLYFEYKMVKLNSSKVVISN